MSVSLDGSNIWVTNLTLDTITKLRASDGTIIGILSAGGASGSCAKLVAVMMGAADGGNSFEEYFEAGGFGAEEALCHGRVGQRPLSGAQGGF
jgi:hypothetical protein